MALSASLVWKNPDATKDLNDRLRRIVQRGVVWGGNVTPGAGLQVIVSPFIAVSYDGMTVGETENQPVNVDPNQKTYIVVRAKYVLGGAPELYYDTIEDSVFNAPHPEREYMIVLATVDLGAVSSVVAEDISFIERDEINPLGRDWYRGRVTNETLLPDPASPANRVGDFYFVDDVHTFYFWTGPVSKWEALNTGSFNSEVTLMNDYLARSERNRVSNGSGVIGGTRPIKGPHATETKVTVGDVLASPNKLDIYPFSALVNGHFVEVRGQRIDLPAAHATIERYDLVFLEVWREEITDLQDFPTQGMYASNPAGSGPYSHNEAVEKVTQMDWTSGVVSTGDNFDINTLHALDHGWTVTKFEIKTISGIPTTAPLYDPLDPGTVALAENKDGLFNFTTPAGAPDDRIWISTSTTAADGVTWAIPLFVLRRRTAAIETYFQQTRNNERHLFHTYPVADIDNATKDIPLQLSLQDVMSLYLPYNEYEDPSGFLVGGDHPLGPGSAANSLQIVEPDRPAKIRIRGFEDWWPIGMGSEVDLGPAPSGTNNWERALVYMKMTITMYDHGATATRAYSDSNKPYILPSFGGSSWSSFGIKQGFVGYELMVEKFPGGPSSENILDTNEAMVAAGWEKGDLTALPKRKFEDGGIWSRSIAIDADDLIHPYETEWAIPIALVHRRNDAAWSTANMNGGISRPDGRNDPTIIHPDDVVDLRHHVGEVDVDNLVRQSIDLNMKGQLRTRMANKYLGSSGDSGEVAGTRILQSDFIGSTAGVGFDMTAPDNQRRIWSDAKEFQSVGTSFSLLAGSGGGPGDLYTFALGGPAPGSADAYGILDIHAPPGSHLVRHLPPIVYADGDPGNATYLDFYGPPCWTTQLEIQAAQPSPATAKYVNNTNSEETLRFYEYPIGAPPAQVPAGAQPFFVTATDSRGRATTMRGYVDLSDSSFGSGTHTAALSWWVHYDRSLPPSSYSANYGLGEVPDEVHKVTLSPGGGGPDEDINVGALYSTMKVTYGAPGSISFAFTAAALEVQLYGSATSTITLLGIDFQNLHVAPDTAYDDITLSHAKDQITVIFPAPLEGTVEATIFYTDSEVSKWVEIGRGGKSVQGLYSYENYEADLVLETNVAVILDDSTWNQVQLPSRTTRCFPQHWERAGAGVGDWYLVEAATDASGYEHSNLVYAGGGLFTQQYVLSVWPQLTPMAGAPNPVDVLRVDYTYTPYQGLSSTGGEVAAIGTSLPKLKKMLHGRVEADSDYYVTQAGPTSYYSGIDIHTGAPTNASGTQHVGRATFGGDARFTLYNKTALVKTGPSYGTQSLTSPKNDWRSLNAAAVLRLPFPVDVDMRISSPAYHNGVMDFDLDPARAGAGAGFHSYAPGYASLENNKNNTVQAVYHHFVNSLALLDAGYGKNPADLDRMMTGPEVYTQGDVSNIMHYVVLFPGLDGAAYFPAYNANKHGMLSRASISAITDAPFYRAGLQSNMILPRPSDPAPAPFNIYDELVDSTTWPKNWTSIIPFVTNTDERRVYCVSPHNFLMHELRELGEDGVYFGMFLSMITPGTAGAYLYQVGLSHSEHDSVIGSRWNGTIPFVDTLRIPRGTGMHHTTGDQLGNVAGTTTTVETSFFADSVTLRGSEVGYPPDWSTKPSTVSALEAMIHASADARGGGRGVYLGVASGNKTHRYNMPVLVPGSGTDLKDVLMRENEYVDIDAEQPAKIPYMPGKRLFRRSNRVFYQKDVGGPIAYVFQGMLINPIDTGAVDGNYHNQLVLQISGGPTGGIDAPSEVEDGYNETDLHGTAIDAFWPIGRPILPPKR